MTSLSDDPVSIGEGFAFFRWHCVEFPLSACCGINDPRPGMGLDACAYLWRKRRG